MKLNGEQVDQMRAWADWYTRSVLDFARGDLNWQKVCAGYTPGFGTTCSFLPHWMLAELMVSRDNFTKGVSGVPRSLVNRDDLAIGSSMVPGDGISCVAYSKAFVKCDARTTERPQTGDLVIIQAEPYKQSHEHIFVFLNAIEPLLWETGESGQAFSNAPSGAVDGKLKRRPMRMKNNRLHAAAGDGMPDRYVQGWLDLSRLDFLSTDWF